MCIAIYKPERGKLTKERLRTCFLANPHGAGFAIPQDGKMVIHKGYFNFEEFWKAFSPLQEGVPALIHFRWRTHGPQNAENCHPWQIDSDHAMIHNGVIKQYDNKKGKLSDTGQFNEDILVPMFAANPAQWLQDWSKKLMEDFIGAGNKVIILGVNGDYQIYREQYGIWDDNCWFSNDGFRPKKQFWVSGPASHPGNAVQTVKHAIPSMDMTEVDKVLEKLEKERVSGKTEKEKDKKKESTVQPSLDSKHDENVAAEVRAVLVAQGRAHELTEFDNHGAE